MDAKAKQELARAIIDTIDRHEDSWVNEARPTLGRYTKPWKQCAAEAMEDEEVRPLVAAMCQVGLVEFPDWAQWQINSQGQGQGQVIEISTARRHRDERAPR